MSCEYPCHTVEHITQPVGHVSDLSQTLNVYKKTIRRHVAKHSPTEKNIGEKIQCPHMDVDKSATCLRVHGHMFASCFQTVLNIPHQIAECSLFSFSWRTSRRTFTRLQFSDKFTANTCETCCVATSLSLCPVAALNPQFGHCTAATSIFALATAPGGLWS